MKGFYRLYFLLLLFVAVDYSILDLDSVAEILVFESIVTEVGITQVVVVYAVEYFTLFALSPSHLVIPLISFVLVSGSPPGGSLAIMTRPRF